MSNISLITIKITENIIGILEIAIFARILLSWIRPYPNNLITRLLYEITEPILKFFRDLIPRTGMIDFSPIFAIISLNVLGSVIKELIENNFFL